MEIATSLLGLLFVLLLIGAISAIIRRYGPEKLLHRLPQKGPESKSLRIVDVMPLDMKRKIVIVDSGASEHVMVLAPDKIDVLETRTKVKKKTK